jgi:hypothetical protein
MTNIQINIVVLGNFNPSILTHQFLVTECGLDLGQEQPKTEQRLPVVSTISYDGISFFADLGRFQITEKKCENPKKSKLPKYLNTYLEKLPYTPITKCGTNFSYNAEISQEKLSSIETQVAKNRENLCKSFQIDNLELEVVFDVRPKNEIIKRWILRTTHNTFGSKTMMKVSRKPDSNSITVDFNYEVSLEGDTGRIRNVTDEYDKIYDLFLAQFKKLFGEEVS